MSAPYRPGQQWPPQRPERPPPIQFRPDEPPAPAQNKALQWTLRIAGLVAVAVVSGLVWYYITSDDGSTPTTTGDGSSTQQPQGGVYEFTPHEEMAEPDTVTDCAEHAYRDIKTFLAETQCESLTRQLFVTKVHGRTIYTSVSVVTMPNEDEANELRQLTDKDGSGNVSDVVKDKVVTIEGLASLSGSDGYASSQSGRQVIIIEADLAPKDKSGNEEADSDLLRDVCKDALSLAPDLGSGTGSG